ncbi:MAG: hypothetical protein ACI9RU_002011, partial [Litorivivens sp.]
SPENCLKSMNCEPDLIIVDDYFATTKAGQIDAKKVLQAFNIILPSTICLHISPTYCYNATFEAETNTYRSNFNQDILTKINVLLHKGQVAA